MDAADLLGDRWAGPLGCGGGLPLRRRRLGGSLVTAFRERSRADRDSGGSEQQSDRPDRPSEPSTSPRLRSSLAKTVVRIEIRLHGDSQPYNDSADLEGLDPGARGYSVAMGLVVSLILIAVGAILIWGVER